MKKWVKISGWVCVDKDGIPDFHTYASSEEWSKDCVAEHSDSMECWEDDREPFGWQCRRIQLVYIID